MKEWIMGLFKGLSQDKPNRCMQFKVNLKASSDTSQKSCHRFFTCKMNGNCTQVSWRNVTRNTLYIILNSFKMLWFCHVISEGGFNVTNNL